MHYKRFWLVFLVLPLGLFLIVYPRGTSGPAETPTVLEPAEPPPGMAKATFGAGCFWCTEAVFQQLKGVSLVVSGYSGGDVIGPTYRQVCTGTTGHAEAIQVTYDPTKISFEELLEVFWQTHDPTTRNRQGNDVGSQYRSVVFYHSEDQKHLAEHYKQKLDDSGAFGAPIVTEIVPFTALYRAEAYHQNYFAENSGRPYCQLFIRPKVEKVKEVFHDKVKVP
ncbi:MAG TPA: peptide-methionine (S)-S-oxide reductase MsrA [Gemmataceae bacterium]|jgi:peptide-methionine (S)-S-oxide reductase|nr:peptide-methionine (S)-S-oxide reductase MsrA [Gemmataceae bacterium]